MNEEMKLQEIERIIINNQYHNTIDVVEAAKDILQWMYQSQPQLTEAEIEQEAKEFANNNCDGSTSWTSMYTAYKAALLARNTSVQEVDDATIDKIIQIAQSYKNIGEPFLDYMSRIKSEIKQHLNPKP